MDLNAFREDATIIAHAPAITDETARIFLTKYPVHQEVPSFLLQALAEEPEDGLEGLLVTAVDRVFSTEYGAHLLPSALPQMELALGSGLPGLRR